MTKTTQPGAQAPAGLLPLLRSPQTGLLTRALLRGAVHRLKTAITPNYWVFLHQGDEIIVGDQDLQVVLAGLAVSLGRPAKIRAVQDPKHSLQEILAINRQQLECLIEEAFGLGQSFGR